MMLYSLKSLKNLLFNIENLKKFLPSGRFYILFHECVRLALYLTKLEGMCELMIYNSHMEQHKISFGIDVMS